MISKNDRWQVTFCIKTERQRKFDWQKKQQNRKFDEQIFFLCIKWWMHHICFTNHFTHFLFRYTTSCLPLSIYINFPFKSTGKAWSFARKKFHDQKISFRNWFIGQNFRNEITYKIHRIGWIDQYQFWLCKKKVYYFLLLLSLLLKDQGDSLSTDFSA